VATIPLTATIAPRGAACSSA
ncbi:hypothetical protein BMAJHU_I0818, partial [Burkholderia mallei JHU]